jgi:hypothetical protein
MSMRFRHRANYWLLSHEVKLVMDPRRGRRALDRPGASGAVKMPGKSVLENGA